MPVRIAAIFGPRASEKTFARFREICSVNWSHTIPRSAADADAILVFGGDGTVHRHLADFIRLALPLLVVPCGSGNDFAWALGLRGVDDALAAWKQFLAKKDNLQKIDAGVISPLNETLQGCAEKHHFCSVAGVGLDAEVTQTADRLPPWLRGSGGYALSLLPAMFRFAALPMRVSTLHPAGQDARYEPTLLAAFANSPAYGGGMKIAPKAVLDDGKLDVCVVRDISKLKLFCLFPTVYFGRHLTVPQVEYFQAEGVRLETEKPLPVYADGEYVCQTPVELSVARSALQVIVPPRHTLPLTAHAAKG